MVLLLVSTNGLSTDWELEQRRLNAVEYNYECTVKARGPSLISKTYYIKWYPNRFGVMGNIDKNDNFTKPSFFYKPGASVSFKTFQNGLTTLPLYIFGGTHGGSKF